MSRLLTSSAQSSEATCCDRIRDLTKNLIRLQECYLQEINATIEAHGLSHLRRQFGGEGLAQLRRAYADAAAALGAFGRQVEPMRSNENPEGVEIPEPSIDPLPADEPDFISE